MVAAIIPVSSISFLSHSHSHSHSQPILLPKIAQSPTLHSRELLSLVNFTKASRIELNSFPSPLSFRPTKHLLIQCRCLKPPFSIHTGAQTVSFFQEIGLNDQEIESLLEHNPTLRLTSLEKIRARILALQSVGIKGIAFCRVITKSSTVLIAEEIDQLIRFVRDDLGGKMEPMQLERLLTSTETKFLVGFDQKVRLLIQLGVLPERIVHVLNNTNLTKALCLKSVEEIERTFAFLNPFGGTDLIVRCPKILNYDLDAQLIPKVRLLNELSGGDVDATGAVLRKLPTILSYSVKHVGSHIELLRSFVGLSDHEIFKIILVFPALISASRERKLRPRIEFLKQCGMDSEDIFKFLTKAPLFIALSADNLAFKLCFLVKIGYQHRTKELAAAMGAVTRTSCKNMQKVIGLFLSYGLSSEEVFVMSKKHPQILQYNNKSLEEKLEYLIEGMGREVGELLVFPAFLGYKLDDRIKHRYEVKRKTLGEGMSINKLLSVSAERFATKIKENSCL